LAVQKAAGWLKPWSNSIWLQGPVIICGGGWLAPKRNFFRGKNFANPTIKKSKIWLPNLKYQLKTITTPDQKLYKKIPFSCHTDTCPIPLLWHEFDNGLWNFLQSKVSCCLHMYFLWRRHLSPNKSENDRDSDSDWFTYCIDIWLLTLLFSLQYFGESCFRNDNKFLLPNPWVVKLFFIYPTFYSLKILFTQPFSLPCQPPP
jgi:hypothetical protein